MTLDGLYRVHFTDSTERTAIPETSVTCTESRLPPSDPLAMLAANGAGIMSALESPPALIRAPLRERGRKRA